jgi:hypothetical protein
MRRTLSLAALFAALGPAAAADFPPVAKLPARPELPDPLVMLNGARVRSKEQWLTQRRPELKELFQHYMYGYLPPPMKIDAKVEREDRKAFDGKATLKEVAIAFGPSGTPPLRLLLVVPNERKGPAPVFLGLSFSPNEKVLQSPDTWPIAEIIGRGYALATIHHNNISPDKAGSPDALFLRFGSKSNPPGPHDWATIAAWAWGLQRGVDYLVTDKDIDRNRIAAVGHSRLGKTVLLAAAFDERIALAIPHQAGCGGTAPSRTTNPKAETVKRINTSFPHWFNGTFKEFNDQVERLPFDQHCLAALVAPRPLLYTNAVEDQWANPEGQFQMLQAADPVYRLLGAGGLEARQMPEVGKLVDSRLGYWIRPGKHSMTREDWKVFLDFADKHLGKAK